MPVGPEFYATLEPKLSQGDIFTDAPWGLIDAPVTVCQPVDRSKPQGKASYAPVEGKGFKGIQAVHAAARLGNVMVLWHDCQIDKFENQGRAPEKWFTAVAPVLPIPTGTGGQAIADGLRRAFFPLPAYPAIGLDQPSYVDLRHVWPIKQSVLTLDHRVGTLSGPARQALYSHLFTFLTQRRMSTNLRCSSCGAGFAPEEAFPTLGGDAE